MTPFSLSLSICPMFEERKLLFADFIAFQGKTKHLHQSNMLFQMMRSQSNYLVLGPDWINIKQKKDQGNSDPKKFEYQQINTKITYDVQVAVVSFELVGGS